MTELDDEIIPEVYDLIDEIGITAVFREFPNLAVDTDGSIVSQGTASDYSVKVSPPQNKMIEVSLNQEILEMEAMEIYLPTGAGTSDAITFTPSLSTEATSMTCLVGGINYSIVKIEPLISGDSVAAYKVYLRRR